MRQNWFMITYVALIGLALALPDLGRSGGLLHLDAVKSWLIASIFLCAGLALPAARLAASAGAWRQHLAIQSVSFVAAPLLGVGVAWLCAGFGLPEAACLGIIILACLPTTIGSCVAITTMAGGSQGLALVDSVLGNLLGVFITPLLVLLCTGHHGAAPVQEVIVQLCLLAVLPVVVGQAIRLRCAAVLDARKPVLGVISGALLLSIVLLIFSDLAHRGLALGAVPVLIAAVALHAAVLGSAWLAGSLTRSSRPDRVAIAITASHKTAALGIPLIAAMFGNGPEAALLVLPVALYHVVQQLTGAGLAGRFRRWCAA